MSLKDSFDNRIFNTFSTSAEGLALLRIFSAIFILFFLIPGSGMSHFAYLSTLPADFYAPPPGPLRLMESFPSLSFFQVVHTVLILSLLAMLLGYHTRWASVTVGLTILILQGFIYSVGKVNHEIVVPLVPLVMAFSNWGAAFSVDAWRNKFSIKPESWPVMVLAIFIAFMMFTAGFPKILGGWLDPSTQAAQGHLFNQFFIRERQALLAGWAAGFDHVIFWEIQDWATVLFEIGFIVALCKASWFRFFTGLAVLFHFSTMMTLNIAFLPNFLAYAVFLNWDKFYNSVHSFYSKRTGTRGEKSARKTHYMITGIFILLLLPVQWMSSRNLGLSNSDLMLHEFVLVTAAFVLVLFLALQKTVRLFTAESSD